MSKRRFRRLSVLYLLIAILLLATMFFGHRHIAKQNAKELAAIEAQKQAELEQYQSIETVKTLVNRHKLMSSTNPVMAAEYADKYQVSNPVKILRVKALTIFAAIQVWYNCLDQNTKEDYERQLGESWPFVEAVAGRDYSEVSLGGLTLKEFDAISLLEWNQLVSSGWAPADLGSPLKAEQTPD